jgi:hypothetical protein
MTVEELIKQLQALPPNAVVTVWDPYYDRETSDVFILTDISNTVHISNYQGEKG